MDRTTLALFAVTLLVAPATAAGGIFTFGAHYDVSGTVQAEGPVGGNNAWGFADCHGTIPAGDHEGGACFALPDMPPGSEARIFVDDDITLRDVGIFAGFDRDGDGCVGCTSADGAWEGVGSVSPILADGDHDLQVFIRTVSLASKDLAQPPVARAGTSGTITVDLFFPEQGPCNARDHPAEREPACGHRFREGALPYPYQTL